MELNMDYLDRSKNFKLKIDGILLYVSFTI